MRMMRITSPTVALRRLHQSLLWVPLLATCRVSSHHGGSLAVKAFSVSSGSCALVTTCRSYHPSHQWPRSSTRSQRRHLTTTHSTSSSDNDKEDDELKQLLEQTTPDPEPTLSPEELHEQEENAAMEEETRDWLQRVVIGLNLCPFAEQPFRDGKLKIDIVRTDDEAEILTLVLSELLQRIDTPGTTLLVCPDCHPNDFEAFLDVVNMIEQGLFADHDELPGNVQVAPFHPLFCFEGSKQDDVDNWTNRSPHPMFHILREQEVSRAVDLLEGDAGKVWKRNVNLLSKLEEELGREGTERVMRGQGDVTDQQRLREIVKGFKLKLGSKGGDRSSDGACS